MPGESESACARSGERRESAGGAPGRAGALPLLSPSPSRLSSLCLLALPARPRPGPGSGQAGPGGAWARVGPGAWEEEAKEGRERGGVDRPARKKREGSPGVLLSLRQTGRLRPAHAPCPPLQVRGGRTWEDVGPAGGLQGRSPPSLSLPPNKTHPVHGAVATGFSLRACASDAGNLRRQLSGQSVSVRRTGGRARVGLVWACVCGKVAGHRRALTSGGHTFSRVVFLFFSSRH